MSKDTLTELDDFMALWKTFDKHIACDIDFDAPKQNRLLFTYKHYLLDEPEVFVKLVSDIEANTGLVVQPKFGTLKQEFMMRYDDKAFMFLAEFESFHCCTKIAFGVIIFTSW